MAEEEAGPGGRLSRAGQTCNGGKKQARGEQGSGSYTGTWPRRRQALEDAYAKLVKLAIERRSRLEESRLLWQFHWDMAEEEAGSGGRLRRAGQAGRGEQEQARGEQAALAVILGHG